MSQIKKNIAEYMSNMSANRKYNQYDVNAIERAIREELKRRKATGSHTRVLKKTDKAQLLIRTAGIANEILKTNPPFTAEDIRLYKKCWAEEYMDRTGKCAWGYANARKRLGYDPNTGIEMSG